MKRIVIADDSGKDRRAGLEHTHQIGAHFIFHGAPPALGRRPFRLLQFTKRRREIHESSVMQCAWSGRRATAGERDGRDESRMPRIPPSR